MQHKPKQPPGQPACRSPSACPCISIRLPPARPSGSPVGDGDRSALPKQVHVLEDKVSSVRPCVLPVPGRELHEHREQAQVNGQVSSCVPQPQPSGARMGSVAEQHPAVSSSSSLHHS